MRERQMMLIKLEEARLEREECMITSHPYLLACMECLSPLSNENLSWKNILVCMGGVFSMGFKREFEGRGLVPPYFLTPRRFPMESRLFLADPPPLLVDVRIWMKDAIL